MFGMVAGKPLAQGEGRPAARGAKDDAVLGKGIDALVDALAMQLSSAAG